MIMYVNVQLFLCPNSVDSPWPVPKLERTNMVSTYCCIRFKYCMSDFSG